MKAECIVLDNRDNEHRYFVKVYFNDIHINHNLEKTKNNARMSALYSHTQKGYSSAKAVHLINYDLKYKNRLYTDNNAYVKYRRHRYKTKQGYRYNIYRNDELVYKGIKGYSEESRLDPKAHTRNKRYNPKDVKYLETNTLYSEHEFNKELYKRKRDKSIYERE